MNETMVTLQGWLGSDVTVRQAGEATVASFRVACTPRRYQKKTDEWVDADTQWYSVSAWRGLAENCERSLRRGTRWWCTAGSTPRPGPTRPGSR